MNALLASIVISQFLAIVFPAAAQDHPHPPSYAATPIINIDRQRAVRAGVSLWSVDEAVGKFFQTHKTFTLTELQSLELKTADARKIALSEIATIEVKFTAQGNSPK